MSGYGWIPDRPDARDFDFTPAPQATPASVSLRSQMPAVYDQGQLGSCTANAIGAAVEHREMREGEGAHRPSRLFIYYCERALEGTVDSDAGAVIRDGMKVVATTGAPPETDWPYKVVKFTQKPPAKAYTDAVKREAKYGRVSKSRASLTASLANGFPFVFGFTVYESFESEQVAETGIVPMPERGEQVLGGHAVLAVGYKLIDGELYYEVRNSWSSSWGDKGYFWMPAAYMEGSQTSDFWSIRFES